MIEDLDFELVDLCGQMALFTNSRIDPSLVPPGLFCYELRYGEDDRSPATMEARVKVNFFGTVVTGCDFGLDREGAYIPLGEEDFGFAGEEWSLAEFQEDLEESGEPLPTVLTD